MTLSTGSDPVTAALRAADNALVCAVEEPDEVLSGPHLRRAVGQLIHAVELQNEQMDMLRQSLRAAHDRASKLDRRTIGSTVLGGR